jgi:hypothetical protein
MRVARPLHLILASALVACASGASRLGTSPAHDANVADIAEIRAAQAQGVTTAYDLVTLRHANWMRTTAVNTRGQMSTASVWLDGQRLGGLSSLRSVLLSTVTQIRYLSPSEAQGQFGLNNLGGAIAVSTR